MAKRYKVVGIRAVFGHQPGEEFSADIPPDQETRLKNAGHIKPVTAKKKETSSGD